MPTSACRSLEYLKREVAHSEDRQQCVLLIEDSQESMWLVERALKVYGRGAYRLAWASNLIEAPDRMKEQKIDVILLDLGLPETRGLVSYSWVRELAPDVPIIVLTGDPRPETRASVLSSGANDYMTKDAMSGPSLIEAIRGAIAGQKNPSGAYQEGGVIERLRWELN